YDFTPQPEEDESLKLTRFKSKDYMDDYINPREALRAEEEERKHHKAQAAKNFPEHPEKDVLLFLIEHAPLKTWQRDTLSIIRDIEHRWNTGKFGKDYDECDDLEKRRNWDKQLGLGRKKIFEVRKVHNDITFIDTFLTPEFCVEHKLFSFAWQEQMGQYVIESREFDKIKQRLLFSLTNFGKPWIYVVDVNYHNRGELLLKHEH